MIQANFSITSLQQCYNKNNTNYINSVPDNDTTKAMCRSSIRIKKDSHYDSYYDTTERILERSNNNNNSGTHTKLQTNKVGTITKNASLQNSILLSNGCRESCYVDKLSNTIPQATTIHSKQLQLQPLVATDMDNESDADANVNNGVVTNLATAVAVSVDTIVTDVSISMDQKKPKELLIKKTVSFANDITFQEYSLIVYDHPYNKDKLALSLDWDHTESYTLPFDIICKERFMKYYPPTRLSYSQRRYRLQQVSPINYTYWRDIILLGGTSSSIRSRSSSSSSDSLIPTTTQCESSTSTMTVWDNNDTNDNDSGSLSSKLSNDSFSCLSPSSTATVTKTCPDLTSLISRFSQPAFNTTMFLALSNLSDSDSDDSENDDDNDTVTTESLDNHKEQTDNDNDVLKTVVVTTTGRTSPTEQSIGLLSEGDDDNDYHSFNSNSNNDYMSQYGCKNRFVSKNLDYQYHLRLVIGEPQ